ncbi:MAG: Crp/Fnr family transcriptional regulator [Lachnospirales bacterium]
MTYELNLYEHFLKLLNNELKIIKFKKNEFIFIEGDKNEYLYIILEGKVELFKTTKSWEERIFYILREENLINEEIIYSNHICSSTSCRAITDVVVYKVHKNIIKLYIEKDCKILEFFYKSMSVKLSRTYRQLKNSGTSIPVEKKISSKLWKLAQDFGIKTDEGVYIDIPLSCTVLSKMIGTKRETVSRCINKLKKNGVLDFKDESFIIYKMEGLCTRFDHRYSEE